MSTQTVVAMVCFIVAAILGLVAAAVPETRGPLVPLAIAAASLGAAVQVS